LKLISYVYDATGVKQAKYVQEEGLSGVSSIDYSGAFIYERGPDMSPIRLKFISQPEGYIEPINPNDLNQGFDYVFQFKDHLGNIRLSYKNIGTDTNPSLQIIEENNYYPFGLKHKGYNSATSGNVNSVASKFKYNGIELEESLGLNLYEMPFRQYDPAIARWTSIDPVVHYSLSTYNAFDNNPVFWADPSGANSTAEWMEENGLTEDDLITVYDAGSADENSRGGCPENDPDCNNNKNDNSQNKDENKGLPWSEIGLGTDFIDKIVFPSLEDATIITRIPVYNEAGQKIGEWTARGKIAFKALVKVGNVLRPVLKGVGALATGISFTGNTIDFINGDMSLGRYAFNTGGTGLSIYATLAYGGPAGVAVGGLIYVGDLVIQTAEESQRQMKAANKNNPTKIHDTNVMSRGFWSEMNSFITLDWFRWGFSR
jgi:RHS repeat-associated protein